LDNGGNFGIDASGYEDDFTKIYVQDGGMIFMNTSQQGFRGWRLTYHTPKDFYLEALIEVEYCSGDDQYGLIIRAPDYSTGFGYYAGLSCNGQYHITKWDENGIQQITEPAANNSVNAGPGQKNLIGVQAQGNLIKLYVNDVLVSEMSDTRFDQGGHFGIFISGRSVGDFKFKVDSIQYWNLK
jgi:hypothetical protein